MDLNGVPINYIIARVSKGLNLNINYDVHVKAQIVDGKMYKTFYFSFKVGNRTIDINVPDVGDNKVKSAAVFLEHELWRAIRNTPLPNEVFVKLSKGRNIDL